MPNIAVTSPAAGSTDRVTAIAARMPNCGCTRLHDRADKGIRFRYLLSSVESRIVATTSWIA